MSTLYLYFLLCYNLQFCYITFVRHHFFIPPIFIYKLYHLYLYFIIYIYIIKVNYSLLYLIMSYYLKISFIISLYLTILYDYNFILLFCKNICSIYKQKITWFNNQVKIKIIFYIKAKNRVYNCYN